MPAGVSENGLGSHVNACGGVEYLLQRKRCDLLGTVVQKGFEPFALPTAPPWCGSIPCR